MCGVCESRKITIKSKVGNFLFYVGHCFKSIFCLCLGISKRLVMVEESLWSWMNIMGKVICFEFQLSTSTTFLFSVGYESVALHSRGKKHNSGCS